MAIANELWTQARVVAAPPPPPAPASRPVSPRSFRGDIEGLRAVAVLLVLLGHAGVPHLPAGFVGVDVFFVISGFLITGLLLEELDQRGRLSLAAFYARRAKRLLPAAATVLVATLVLTYFFLPRGRWSTTAWDVVASACYAMNWRMAGQSVDYVAANSAPSIAQHFWSLAVEEQFYLVWPLLLLALGWFARRRGRGHRGLYLLGLALIAIPSFAWALYVSPTDPSAYYVTTTRMWELALGGAVAVTAARSSRSPRLVAVPLAWAGLLAVGASAVLIGSTAGFPGYAALGPTLGTAAVIAFGPAAGRAGPALLLGRQPLRYVGGISYSLYLWHWPVLIAAQAQFGDLGVGAALAVVAVSAIPAALTYHLVENPVRRSPTLTDQPAVALRVGAVCTGAAALAGLAFQLAIPSADSPTPASSVIMGQVPGASTQAAPPSAPGAAALGSSPRTSRAGLPVDRVDSITPNPVTAARDAPSLLATKSCHVSLESSTPEVCVYGKKDAATTIALVGDSHADQWVPAMRGVAETNGWRIATYTKSGCPFLTAEITQNDRPYTSCTEWNRKVREGLLGGSRPDLLIVTNAEYPVRGEPGRSAMAREMRKTWSGMVAEKIPVVVLRDTPLHLKDVAECVSKNPNRLTKCANPREEVLGRGGGPAQEEAADGLAGVRLVDLNDWICPADRCAPVIGGVLVWRDAHHLTATYSATLAGPLGTALKPVVAGL
ncbi:acyltransferase family protein [Micromonospora lupini]|uniref:Putative acyltransferase n=1 Tax=Micromonospora lupini str. Lupac 08 TaxID=1150864 RepID=I0L4X6_9ACTN|nr:acyltransferase family protein [Micromonospora lupini]CCH18873.1 Putative acyltransferase [Micromonospora lupini str. Lupac 08]